jgi:hypothetical protein
MSHPRISISDGGIAVNWLKPLNCTIAHIELKDLLKTSTQKSTAGSVINNMQTVQNSVI